SLRIPSGLSRVSLSRRGSPTPSTSTSPKRKSSRSLTILDRNVSHFHWHAPPLCDFDWTWPGKIDRKAVEEIATLGFLEDAGNVVLVAPQGLGKTMIAQNLAHAAVVAGHTSRFITASDLLLDLSGQDSAR